MDLQLEGTDGVTGTRQLLDRHPEMRVLVLTGLPLSPTLVHDVADSGASGLLPKSASLGVVVDTIPSLGGHSFAVDRQSLIGLCESAGGAEVHRGRGSSLLTGRERDILALLVSGVDLQTAAVRLGITVNTARGVRQEPLPQARCPQPARAPGGGQGARPARRHGVSRGSARPPGRRRPCPLAWAP